MRFRIEFAAEAERDFALIFDHLFESYLTLDARQRLQTERTGEIGGHLVADAASRAALSGLEAEISTAKATLEVWQAVNMAVGSKNGDRFARLAQSITLDVLVDRANHHLGDLKPRYRLKRILSKHPKSMLVGIKHRSHLGAIGPGPMAEVVSLQKTGPDQKSPSARQLDVGDLARFVRSFSRRA